MHCTCIDCGRRFYVHGWKGGEFHCGECAGTAEPPDFKHDLDMKPDYHSPDAWDNGYNRFRRRSGYSQGYMTEG